YALPVMSGIGWTNIMFYNRRLLEEAGLPSNAGPASWEDWKQAAMRMTRRSADGRIVQGGSDIPTTQAVAFWNGADMWSDDWRAAGVDTDRVEETVLFLSDLLVSQYGSWSEYR